MLAIRVNSILLAWMVKTPGGCGRDETPKWRCRGLIFWNEGRKGCGDGRRRKRECRRQNVLEKGILGYGSVFLRDLLIPLAFSFQLLLSSLVFRQIPSLLSHGRRGYAMAWPGDPESVSRQKGREKDV
jgi:hypothetical protein